MECKLLFFLCGTGSACLLLSSNDVDNHMIFPRMPYDDRATEPLRKGLVSTDSNRNTD